mgnify:CR=1 FL=1
MRLAMKLGRSFAGTTPLPRRPIEKTVEKARDFRLGPFGANYFDEVEVTWRVEEVNAEKVCLKSSERPAANCAIGMPLVFEPTIEPGFRCCFDPFVQAPFDFEVFNDGFDNQIDRL